MNVRNPEWSVLPVDVDNGSSLHSISFSFNLLVLFIVHTTRPIAWTRNIHQGNPERSARVREGLTKFKK